MTDKERIEILELQVKELKLNLSRVTPWSLLSKNIDNELDLIFSGDTYKAYQVKSAITCLLNKSFKKTSVVVLNYQECEESKVLVRYILDYMILKRRER